MEKILFWPLHLTKRIIRKDALRKNNNFWGIYLGEETCSAKIKGVESILQAVKNYAEERKITIKAIVIPPLFWKKHFLYWQRIVNFFDSKDNLPALVVNDLGALYFFQGKKIILGQWVGSFWASKYIYYGKLPFFKNIDRVGVGRLDYDIPAQTKYYKWDFWHPLKAGTISSRTCYYCPKSKKECIRKAIKYNISYLPLTTIYYLNAIYILENKFPEIPNKFLSQTSRIIDNSLILTI